MYRACSGNTERAVTRCTVMRAGATAIPITHFTFENQTQNKTQNFAFDFTTNEKTELQNSDYTDTRTAAAFLPCSWSFLRPGGDGSSAEDNIHYSAICDIL